MCELETGNPELSNQAITINEHVIKISKSRNRTSNNAAEIEERATDDDDD